MLRETPQYQVMSVATLQAGQHWYWFLLSFVLDLILAGMTGRRLAIILPFWSLTFWDLISCYTSWILKHTFWCQSRSSFWGPNKFSLASSITSLQLCMDFFLSCRSKGSGAELQGMHMLFIDSASNEFCSSEVYTKSYKRGRLVAGSIGMSTILPSRKCHSMFPPSIATCRDTLVALLKDWGNSKWILAAGKW